LRRHGRKVVEVNRPDRRVRRQRGKSDPIDAENAARAVLAGTVTATPKTGEGTVEMIRHTKIARDTAVKSRTQAMVTLKALIVTVPDELREQLQGLSKMTLIERCAGLRPGTVTTVLASAKRSLRSLARRWLDLNEEIKDHDRLLDELTRKQAPTSWTRSGSAQTRRPRSWSWSATTPNGSARRRRSPSSQASAPSLLPPAGPTGTDSTAAATGS
jgi:transposase